MHSDKPQAKKAKAFQDWVTRAALPAIRKDGAYIMGEEKVAAGKLSDDELVMRAMSIISRKVERLTLERDRLPLDNQLLTTHMQIQAHAIFNVTSGAIGKAVGALRSTTVTDLARKLDGADLQQIQKTLGSINYQYRHAGSWAVNAKYRDVYFAEKAAPDGRSVIGALERGKQMLTQLYHDGDRHPADTGAPKFWDRGNRLSPLSGQRRHCRRENTVKKWLISPHYHQRLSVARLHHSSGV
ncbi:hypothetical protein M1B35_22225 [Pseudomonas sp. MAFF 302046]|uniref:Bro-N domain-containing protein n=2 Tax=Pseudomonas morbosilactucae TaxID=2938197 RepID=A0ABT0JLF6_9PSED|nr:hypothetical protein [Pseudomonas morbosilactucae]